MTKYFNTVILKVTMLKQSEQKLVLWSFIYFFCLLSGYFILRPLRDEMGIINGADKMQWLFTGTFIAMLLVVPLFGYITRKNTIGKILTISYIFFILNVLLFYFLFKLNRESKVLAISFFIWLSVFNLFAVSLFWSFMVDVYSSEASKRTFGIIASGGSIGALTGPLISSFIASNSSIENLLLIAAIFLLMALISTRKIIVIKDEDNSQNDNIIFNPKIILEYNFWYGLQKVLNSKYLLGIIFFILIYTSISTILYFEQAHVLENSIKKSSHRIVYFSRVDFLTNAIAIIGQMLFTNRIIKKFGLAITLASIPILIGLGFVVISLKLSLMMIAILIIVHRAGNFSLLRPAREILFTVCTKEEKYRSKNFIDTVIYRGGDALTGWAFTLLVSLGFGLSVIALIAIPLVIVWSLTGYRLGKKQLIKEKELYLNYNSHEK